MKKTICVYCSSSSTIDPEYLETGRHLGTCLATAGYDLVYGGTDAGCMGAVAYQAQAGGSHVTGIVTRCFVDMGLRYQDADEVIIAETMAERKQAMEDRADAFVVLPGGFGTLEELMQVITLRLLNFHQKPIILLNSDDFYAPLLTLFEQWIEQGFAADNSRALITVVSTVDEAMAALTRELGDGR